MLGADEGWETVTISGNEENYVKIYVLMIFAYIKALIKFGRTVNEKGPMDESMTSCVPQALIILKEIKFLKSVFSFRPRVVCMFRGKLRPVSAKEINSMLNQACIYTFPIFYKWSS